MITTKKKGLSYTHLSNKREVWNKRGGYADFFITSKMQGGWFEANTFLSHEKSAWMGYKIWKNNKRNPSFIHEPLLQAVVHGLLDR